jgi:hypothetical protein
MRSALRIVQAVLLFYVACVAYRVLALMLFVLAVGTGALIAGLRGGGGRDPPIMFVAAAMDVARGSVAGMVAFAAAVVLLVGLALRKRQAGEPTSARRGHGRAHGRGRRRLRGGTGATTSRRSRTCDPCGPLRERPPPQRS